MNTSIQVMFAIDTLRFFCVSTKSPHAHRSARTHRNYAHRATGDILLYVPTFVLLNVLKRYRGGGRRGGGADWAIGSSMNRCAAVSEHLLVKHICSVVYTKNKNSRIDRESYASV